VDILVACEFSGVVRRAFRKRGHNAWSCDLLPADDESPFHITGDVTPHLRWGWDLMIAHPPCTYLANSGAHWLHRQEGRWEKMREGALFFKALWEAPVGKVCVENPVMHKYAKEIIGSEPTQSIQPYQFGHPESKRTCLWLKGLPLLLPTNVLPKPECGYWSNQTPSGQNKYGPSADRWAKRSVTYTGIAEAMAEQWG
jgi:hypothetical protein